MIMIKTRQFLILLVLFVFLFSSAAYTEEQKEEILPSWNNGLARETILEYVKKSTSSDNKDFIPEEDRIAVFRDNGTLICEEPNIQLVFLKHSVNRLDIRFPIWQSRSLSARWNKKALNILKD